MTHIDQYVLGLAVSSTPCFGYHEANNPTCAECPVVGACASSWRTRASTVAAQLVKSERAARRVSSPAAAPTVTTAPVAAAAPAVGESIDDILDSISKGTVGPTATASAPVPPPPVQDATDAELEELFGPLLNSRPAAAPTPAVTTAPPAPVAPAPTPRVTMMKAVIDSVCFSCGGRIPAKSDAAFIPGKGVRHPGCP